MIHDYSIQMHPNSTIESKKHRFLHKKKNDFKKSFKDSVQNLKAFKFRLQCGLIGIVE